MFPDRLKNAGWEGRRPTQKVNALELIGRKPRSFRDRVPKQWRCRQVVRKCASPVAPIFSVFVFEHIACWALSPCDLRRPKRNATPSWVGCAMAKSGIDAAAVRHLLREAVQNSGWALCVGAGASCPVFPLWAELVSAIAGQDPAMRGRPDLVDFLRDRYSLSALIDAVEGSSKRRRRERVGAVEIGGAHWSISEKWQDGGVSPYSAPLRREAQECDPTWSFGKRFVGRC